MRILALTRQIRARTRAKRGSLAAHARDEHHALAEAQDVASQARIQYDALARERSREQSEYESRFNGLRKEVRALCTREVERQNQLTRIDVIIEQKNREITAERERMHRFGELFAEYKDQSERAIRHIVEKSHQNDATIDEIVTHVTEVAGRMRWVLAVKETKGAE